jgi:lipopolysaccharide export system permease protein
MVAITNKRIGNHTRGRVIRLAILVTHDYYRLCHRAYIFEFGSSLNRRVIIAVSIIDEGLWLRQEDGTGNFILKADTVNGENWELSGVNVYFFDNKNKHTQRLNAVSAYLNPNEWVFQNVTVQHNGNINNQLDELRLATSLTTDTISESFSNPQTISFWRLPSFIKSLEQTGLDTTQMKIYYQNLLVQPLFLISMVLLAAATSLRTSRFTKLLPVVLLGLGMGFTVFFFAGFLRALGSGHEIPIFMAIWIPPIIIILCAIATLITLEDG